MSQIKHLRTRANAIIDQVEKWTGLDRDIRHPMTLSMIETAYKLNEVKKLSRIVANLELEAIDCIPEDDYQVSYPSEYDNGYGVESASDDIVIYRDEEGQFSASASGIHFMTEDECEWEVEELEDTQMATMVLDQAIERQLKRP